MKINKSNVDNNQILMNQINKAIDVKITTKNSLDQLLQDKFYKDLIFNNESSANLESSALIVELIRKKNPYLILFS